MRASSLEKRRYGEATSEDRIARVINGSYSPLESFLRTDHAQRLIMARASGDLMNAMPWDEWLHSLGSVVEPMQGQIANALREQSRTLLGGVQAATSFEVVDAISQKYAAEQSSLLIRNLQVTQRQTIRHIITEAMTGHETVDSAARKIRSGLGLHQSWADAVVKLGDRRFAEALKAGMPLDVADRTAARAADTYRKRLVRSRSKLIARTEIQTSTNVGIFASWENAIGQGSASQASRKEWDAGPGACSAHCTALSGKVVGWDQPFPNGKLMPPAHPGCRCTANMLPPEYGDDALDPRKIDQLNPDAGGQYLDGYAGRSDAPALPKPPTSADLGRAARTLQDESLTVAQAYDIDKATGDAAEGVARWTQGGEGMDALKAGTDPDVTAAFTGALQNAPLLGKPVYRGMYLEGNDLAQFAAMKPGTIIEPRFASSYSSSRRAAENYLGMDDDDEPFGVFFTLKDGRGLPVGKRGRSGNDSEVIIGHNVRVVNIIQEGNVWEIIVSAL